MSPGLITTQLFKQLDRIIKDFFMGQEETEDQYEEEEVALEGNRPAAELDQDGAVTWSTVMRLYEQLAALFTGNYGNDPVYVYERLFPSLN